MNLKRITTVVSVILLAALTGQSALAEQAHLEEESAKITITPSEQLKMISPYIFGVNTGVDLNAVSAKSIRLGGNRMSAYNWENNMSNAGADYYNTSDLYLVSGIPAAFRQVPGGPALALSDEARQHNIPYTLLTLQMLGYVTSDQSGRVTEENAAPSDNWVKVENRKNEVFSLVPDTTDGIVYIDEYLHYLFDKLGKSDSETGIKAFALDNEPVLWKYTHSLIQHGDLSCAEIIARSVNLASLVKEMDAGAEVFGPSLFGYSAFVDFGSAPDWQQLKADNNYRWFIDYYLDEMCRAEANSGTRILDVLDIHFYTEAKGACGERSCNHYDNDDCIKARLDSVKSLYDETYRENSWITDTGAAFFPLLPNLQQSIDAYYPDTKIAFSEYNFGGGDHISGAVAEADTLGIFAEYGVYFATIWSFDNNQYQLAAINMFTNYDGNGNGFGDTLVKSEYENETISVYSSIDSSDTTTVKMIVTNHSIHDETPVEITIAANDCYQSAEVYSLYGDSPQIQVMPAVESITENTFSYTLPPLSVTEFVITKPDTETTGLQTTLQKLLSKKGIIMAAACAVIAATAMAIAFVRKKK